MAREEAWEEKYPGIIRVLLSNPRCERHLLRLVELSGVNGPCGMRRRGKRRSEQSERFPFSLHFVQWDSYPETSAQRVLRANDLFCFPLLKRRLGDRAGSLCLGIYGGSAYRFGIRGRNQNLTN
jgi:hypothetical protein